MGLFCILRQINANMKYSKTLLPVLLLSALLFIISCRKSETAGPSPLAGKIKLIQSVIDGYQSKTEYQYDNKGFLISISNTPSDGNTGSLNELKNDSDGKPVFSTIYRTKKGEAPKKHATVDLVYEDNRLVEYRQVLAESGSTSVQKYLYNNQHFLASSTTTQNVNTPNPYVYESFTYTTDSKGMVTGQTRKTYFTNPNPATHLGVEKYEYDDKVNPTASILTALYQPHNTIKTSVKWDQIPDDIVVVFASTYDYNAGGLPVKEYNEQPTGRVLARVYEYY